MPSASSFHQESSQGRQESRQGHQESSQGRRRTGLDVFRLLAGIADLALDQAAATVRHAHSLLGRSDLPDIAADYRADLKARGDIVLGAIAPSERAHLELLASHAAARGEDGGA